MERKNVGGVRSNKIHTRINAQFTSCQNRTGGKTVSEMVAALRKKEKGGIRKRAGDTREVTVHARRNRRGGAGRWERRKSYLHQDSARFSSYHTANTRQAYIHCWHRQRRRVVKNEMISETKLFTIIFN